MRNEIGRARTLALWVLRRVGPRENREAMIGDLLEQVSAGKSATWFWREVLSALVAGMRWADVGLALLAPVLPILLWRPLLPIALWRLPNPFLDGGVSGFGWPTSAMIGCSVTVTLLTLLVMIELMVVSAFRRTFSWANVGRWMLMAVPMLSLGLFLSLELDGHLPHKVANVVDQVWLCGAMLAGLWTNQGRAVKETHQIGC